MTPNANNQNGCAWLNSTVDFSEPLSHTMTVNFGDNDVNGADGICLVYQTGGPAACGGTGAGIGAAGIPNSFIVEFDTWDNGPAQADIPEDHCAVALNGDLTNQINGPVALGNIEDGADHTITFTWNPATNAYTVLFDGVLVLSGTYDIVNLVFGGNPNAYWGYTSATGAASNLHLVCPVLPPPIPVNAGPNLTVPCADGLLTLNAAGTAQGPNYIYQWSSPDGGSIIAGGTTLTPTVMGPGTYVLTLTDLNGGCEETDEVFVSIDPLVVSIDAPIFAPCAGAAVTLDGSASSSGPFVSYLWTSPDGEVLGNATAPIVGASDPGTYILTVTYDDGTTLCTAEASILLQPDPNTAFAQAQGDTLTCDQLQVELNSAGSSIGPEFDYLWTTPDGLILSGENSLSPTVGGAGNYTLTVTNSLNGCTDEVTVEVFADTLSPAIQIEEPNALDCSSSVVTLDASATLQNVDLVFQWETPDGNFLAGADSSIALVDSPGVYILLATNPVNACADTQQVEVVAGPDAPLVNLAPPDTLTCLQPEVLLDASASEQRPELAFQWSSPDGQIIGPDSLLNALAASGGTYVFTSVDTLLGCTTRDTVVVLSDNLPPTADAGSGATLLCSDSTALLDGTNSSTGPGLQYFWTTPNGTLAGPADSIQSLASAAGLYVLEVTNPGNGCTAQDSVTILSDANAPVVAIALPDTLTCDRTQISLDGSASSQGSDLSILWTTADGNFTGNPQGLQTDVDQPGTYTLTLVDTTNACQGTASVTVAQDIEPPVALIALPDTFNCALESLALDGTGSSSGAGISYLWQTTNGQISGGADSPSPTVDAPGTYELTVTDQRNGCTQVASIELFQDTLPPEAVLLEPEHLSCIATEVEITAVLPPSGSFQSEWTTADGLILAGSQTPNALAAAPGTYQFVLTDLENQCTDTASLNVVQDTLPPVVAIAQPDTLTCTRDSLLLDGSNSSSGTDFSYDWSTTDGQLLGGVDQVLALAGLPGTYTLTIWDASNGCRDSASVTVFQDVELPTVRIASPDTLTCTRTVVSLDGSNSDQGPGLQYTWTTPNGTLAGDSSQIQVNATAAGLYNLEVSNVDNGCTASETVRVFEDVEPPGFSIQPADPLTCQRDSVRLSASLAGSPGPVEVLWSGPDDGIVQGGNSLTPDVTRAGVYTLAVTNLNNGCSAIQSLNVPIDTISPIAAAGSDFLLPCWEELQRLDGSGSSSGPTMAYTWRTTDGVLLDGLQSIEPGIGSTGTYILEVRDTENGCTSEDSVRVSQDLPQMTVSSRQPLCPGEAGQVRIDSINGGLGPYLVSVDGGQTFLSETFFTQLMPQTYEVIVQDINGCTDEERVQIVEPPPLSVAALDSEPEIRLGEAHQIRLVANTELDSLLFDWSDAPGLSCYGCPEPLATPLESTRYTLEITSNGGCRDQLEVRVIVDRRTPVYLPNAFSPNADGRNDFFFPQTRPGALVQVTYMRIFSRWGEPVFENRNFQPNAAQEGWDGRFRGKPLNTGVYTYLLEVELIDGSRKLLSGDLTLLR